MSGSSTSLPSTLDGETAKLLVTTTSHGTTPDVAPQESSDAAPKVKGHIGLTSATFLIFNRIIGTGIFATPSLILRASGSVGMALLMWVFGSLIGERVYISQGNPYSSSVASAGLAVYIEWGTGLPKSGGEKNYLQFLYRRPPLLVTCMFAGYACLIV